MTKEKIEGFIFGLCAGFVVAYVSRSQDADKREVDRLDSSHSPGNSALRTKAGGDEHGTALSYAAHA